MIECVQIIQTAGYNVTHMVDVRLYYFKANLCAAHISRGLNMVGLYCEKIKILKDLIVLSYCYFDIKCSAIWHCTVVIHRECVRTGAAGAQTRIPLGHQLLHPQILTDQISENPSM